MKTEKQIQAVFDFIRVTEGLTDDDKVQAALESMANTLQWVIKTKFETELE